MGGQYRPVTAPLGITLSVTAGNGDSTWILLHGSDGRETDLLPIVDRVRPGGGRIALRGAVRTELGYAFFDRRPDRTFDDDEVAARVDPLAEAIDLGLRITRRAGRVTILGFSNGAVMAAALLERRPDLFTGGVLLRPQPPFRAEPPRSGAVLPVLVVDGQADERRSREDGARTAERLRQAGAVVEHLTLAVGHGITADDEQAIRDWLDGTSERTRGTSPVPQRRMNASTDDREGAAMSDTSNSQPEDITVPTNDEDGTAKSGGLGDDSTIPNHPDGVAAGFSETDSHFNPEEDPEHE